MNRSPQITRLIGFLVVLATLSLAGAGFYVVRDNLRAARESAKENILWSALQLEIELLRFREELARFAAGDDEATPESVNERFDILWSRLDLFKHGSVGARLSAYDRERQAADRLFALMKEVEEQIVALAPGDRDKALALARRFDPFQAELRALSRDVLHGEQNRERLIRDEIEQSAVFMIWVSLAAVAASLILLVVFWRESVRLRQIAEENERLYHEAQAASRAKSRFLTMMSHELRTPMNGVLGLIALLRQTRMSPQQERLVGQIDRAGRQIAVTLEDVLDYADLEDEQLRIESKPFATAELARAIEEMFRPVAAREAVRLRTRCAPGVPARLRGDFRRLRQAFTQLVTYLFETAGTRDIELTLDWAPGARPDSPGELIGRIRFRYEAGSGEAWRPELIVDPEARKGDNFATEALGPALARGVIQRMGGSIAIEAPPGDGAGDAVEVVVRVPAQAIADDATRVRLAVRSGALATVCRAALVGASARILEDDSENPDVVIIEAGGESEEEDLTYFGQRWPDALLVALGTPRRPERFDLELHLPRDMERLRSGELWKRAV